MERAFATIDGHFFGCGEFISRQLVHGDHIMSSYVYHSSRPHESILPRAHRDAHQRLHTYGPIQPMDGDRGLFGRLLDRLF